MYEEKNYLLFERRGCELLYDKTRQESDIGNYRITTPGAIVPCKNGRDYLFEFIATDDICGYRTAHLSAYFKNEKELWRGDPNMEKRFKKTSTQYIKADILKWVNSVSTVKYDEIKYVHTFEIEIKPGENFTPATKIHDYMTDNKIPETIGKYGEKQYKLYTGLYKYYKYEIKKLSDHEIVTFYLDA